MNNLTTLVFTGSLLMGSSITSAEIHGQRCPSELVNFWKNYAFNTENYSAIPVFLLQNECLRVRISTDFHTAMTNRFDHPDNARYIDDLYAQLNWKQHKGIAQIIEK